MKTLEIQNNESSAVQYAYVHEDREGRWHAYGTSARLLQLLFKETLGVFVPSQVRSDKASFEPIIDSVELEFSNLLKCNIVLCSDTSLVIECPLELLGKAS